MRARDYEAARTEVVRRAQALVRDGKIAWPLFAAAAKAKEKT